MSVNRTALPKALYTAAQTASLDRLAIEQFAIPGIRLMQRAGHALFAEIMERYPQITSLSIFAGTGNNGGDGFIVALLARQKNIKVQLICVGSEDFPAKLQGEALQAWQLLRDLDASYEHYQADISIQGQLIVDALLGTGLRGEVREPFRSAIEAINAAKVPVLAADVPSGICVDTGQVLGTAVKADLTLSFIGLNRGLLTSEAVNYTGEVLFDDLKVPDEVYLQVPTRVCRTLDQDVQLKLPSRAKSSHKGNNGHLLIVGGNSGMGGAVLLAAEAALRSGAGLVSVATRPQHLSASLSRCPEAMCHAVEGVGDLQPLLSKADVVLIGPGLGQDAWAESMLKQVLASDKKRVIDADALNIMTHKKWFNPSLSHTSIFTPHPGEASRILREPVATLQKDRFNSLLELKSTCGGAVVLKGAGSLSMADDTISVCDKGNPGMAVGGMGDVLSGICGAFLAQGLRMEDAAALAVYIHASAADYQAQEQGEIGLLPSDLCRVLPRVINSIHETT